MTTPADAASIDWASIALWAGGVSGVLSSVGAAVWLGVKRAVRIAESLPQPSATIHKTDVYTTDSAALQKLTNAVETACALIAQSHQLQVTANALMTEGNALRRDATMERRSLRDALDLNTEMTERSVETLAALQLELRDLIKEFIRSQR